MVPFLPALLLAATAAGDPDAPERGRLALLIGDSFDLDTQSLSEAAVEWRFPRWKWNLSPIVGATWFEGNAAYAYGGLRYAQPLGNRFELAPALVAGVFDEGELDLGRVIEFRSSLELAWIVEDHFRIGVAVSHYSNSRIGERNPGRESLALTITFEPLELFR